MRHHKSISEYHFSNVITLILHSKRCLAAAFVWQPSRLANPEISSTWSTTVPGHSGFQLRVLSVRTAEGARLAGEASGVVCGGVRALQQYVGRLQVRMDDTL